MASVTLNKIAGVSERLQGRAMIDFQINDGEFVLGDPSG